MGTGAACVVCNDRRLGNLQRIELFGRWLPLCHLCAVRSRHLLPMPASIEGIRKALRRERRDLERRSARPDTRLDPKDRRGPDRRAIPLDDSDLLFVADLPAAELTELALDLVFEPPVGEATRIYDKLNPAELAEATVRRVMPPPTPRLDLEPPREKVEVEVVEHLAKRRIRAGAPAAEAALPAMSEDTRKAAQEAAPEAAQAAAQEAAPETGQTAAPEVSTEAAEDLSASLLLHALLPPPNREAQSARRASGGGLVLFELPMPQPPVPWSPLSVRAATRTPE